MRALSDLLWHERDLLELVLHRLETEHALLETGRTRRLALAAREVDDAVEQLRTAELARAAEAADAAQVLGLPADSTLATIGGLAPVPWGQIYVGHLASMRGLVTEITALTAATPPGAPAADLGALDDAGGELTDAVVEVELERMGRQAAELRGPVIPRELLDFLA